MQRITLRLDAPRERPRHPRCHAPSGWVAMLKLMMLLSVYVDMFHLLPLPGLDGNHIVSLAYQIATRRGAKPRLAAGR